MKRLLLCVLCALLVLVSTSSASAAPVYTVDRKDLSLHTELSRDVQNILMLLQDSGSGASSRVLLVASINRVSGRAVMVSLVPDVLVQMPLAGTQPLCDAYLLGGVNLAMKTVNEVYGLNIQHFAVIDVNNFGKIVETVGGMQMNLNAQEAQALGLSEGEQTLDPEKSMAYMRLTSDDPSVSRPYKAVMQLLYQGTRDKDPLKLMSLGTNLLKAVDTNLGVMDLLSLASSVMGGSQREELLVPAAQELKGTEWNGRALYTADLEAAKELLHATLYP